jgi:hypothetical protein
MIVSRQGRPTIVKSGGRFQHGVYRLWQWIPIDWSEIHHVEMALYGTLFKGIMQKKRYTYPYRYPLHAGCSVSQLKRVLYDLNFPCAITMFNSHHVETRAPAPELFRFHIGQGHL